MVHSVLHYYTVIFRYYAVSMYDVGDCNMWKSYIKFQGNTGIREFFSVGVTPVGFLHAECPSSHPANSIKAHI